jgi:hypothetical protein
MKKDEENKLFILSSDFYFFQPVLRAAMCPTFAPGGASLLTVVGWLAD